MTALYRQLLTITPGAKAALMCLCACAMTSLLVACSGGGTVLSGGVGSGGSGVAEGPVSGFGSVIVAGVEYDDTNASVVTENSNGGTEPVEVKLGQRVRIQHSKSGVADTIQVLPQLSGTASTAQDGQGVFSMLGQTIQIISTGDAQNTATVLDGLTSVVAGDEVEVHGNWIFDSSRNHSILIATRIEKLSAAVDPVLVSGVVRTRNGNVVTLDDASGQNLTYSNLPTTIVAQSSITAWVARSDLPQSTWPAIRVVDASPSLNDGDLLQLNTQVSDRDVAEGQIRVQGMWVKFDSRKNNVPRVGSTVQVEIVREGNSYKAVNLQERQQSSELGGSIELKGSLLWPADPTQITLRGNAVSTTRSVLDSTCLSLKTNDNTYLEIKAERTAPGQPLKAVHVSCSQQIPTTSVMEVSGTLTQIDSTNQTLQVTTNNGALRLTWNNMSLLPRNLNDMLNRRVEIEYQIVSSENRLRKLKPD